MFFLCICLFRFLGLPWPLADDLCSPFCVRIGSTFSSLSTSILKATVEIKQIAIEMVESLLYFLLQQF